MRGRYWDELEDIAVIRLARIRDQELGCTERRACGSECDGTSNSVSGFPFEYFRFENGKEGAVELGPTRTSLKNRAS